MKTVLLQWHLGLGDAIICNGMVRCAAKSGWDNVILPAKPQNYAAVRWMFSDDPHIRVVEVGGDDDVRRIGRHNVVVGLGVFSRRGLQPMNWDKAFYQDAQVPFECRWSEFKLPDPPNVCHRVGSVFIHDDPRRNYRIALAVPRHVIYMPSAKDPFEYHIPTLQTADEIHVIDSCFLALADSIETNATRHVLHLYATARDPYKRFGPPTLRKNWEILR